MSKVKLKQPTTAVSAKTNKQAKCNKGKVGKKKKYFYEHMKPKPKESKKNLLPPRNAAEFSANWKSLLLVSINDCQWYACISVPVNVSVLYMVNFNSHIATVFW